MTESCHQSLISTCEAFTFFSTKDSMINYPPKLSHLLCFYFLFNLEQPIATQANGMYREMFCRYVAVCSY